MRRIYPEDFEPAFFQEWFPDLLTILGYLQSNCTKQDAKKLRALLIKKMAESLFLPINIIPVPTMREEDGLAMSSRNLLLTPEERKLAPRLHHWITQKISLVEMKQHLTEEGFRVDYLEEFQDRRLVAAYLGNVRLIDNVRTQ